MKIIVDVFGGDNAPLAVMQGCVRAKEEYPELDLMLVGDTEQMKKIGFEHSIHLTPFELVHAPDVFDIHTDPAEIRTAMKESSMAIALKQLAAGNGDAVVSAGSTGALLAGATMFVKRIKGIKRGALAPIMPSAAGSFMLMDAGATLECKPEMLYQFGVMGSIYMKKILGVDAPRVGQINVGAEDTKGTELQKEAYVLLQNSGLNFVGNIEARDVPFGACDVLVADGFSGNIVLKMMEGMGAYFADELKGMFYASAKTKLGALLLKKQVMTFKKKLDYTEYGGAVLMGIAKPVIKAHGSSNAKAFKNAIRQAKQCVEQNIIEEITLSLQQEGLKPNTIEL